ncbi:uncharacterized protein LOC121430955 [Lytechinus variegatus]|uniref:uncharacterized protein LOC121430955 n=1 Tax=Lytechinus variegatus TaxID=7654 RepID=UPI001BB1D340|nr:uncharacterized protein LOC121430955 [Lytechinus variegatus]
MTTFNPSSTLTSAPSSTPSQSTPSSAPPSTAPFSTSSTQTTLEQKANTLSSVTLGLTVTLALVGIIALTLLMVLFIWILWTRLSKNRPSPGMKALKLQQMLSSKRMGSKTDFKVSPVEIFPQEESGSFENKETEMVITSGPKDGPSEYVKIDVDEVGTKTNDVDETDRFHEAETLEYKRGNNPLTQLDNLYINGTLPTGCRRSREFLELIDNDNVEVNMPPLPQGTTNVRVSMDIMEKSLDANMHNIPSELVETRDLAPGHDGDGEYAYANIPDQGDSADEGSGNNDRVDVADDYCYPEFPGMPAREEMNENEYASVNDNNDGDDESDHDYNEPLELSKDMEQGISRQLTTNHYNNKQMLVQNKGRKAQIK